MSQSAISKLSISYLKFLLGVRNKLSIVRIVSYATILNVFLGLLFGLFTSVNNPVFEENYSVAKLLVILILAGPLVETLIFQNTIITITNRVIKNNFVSVLISALIFGLCHNYGVTHQMKTFLSGLLYASLYIMYRSKSRSTLTILCCHSLSNASIYGFDYLFTSH